MVKPARQMKLGAFINPTGQHVAAWRHPSAQADAGVNFNHYVDLMRTVERGRFDIFFLADVLATIPRTGESMASASRIAHYVGNFEPLTLLSALAAVSSNTGLVATVTTSYNEPYHVARKFASLDHISGGRSGWNLVTSSNADEAYNFGLEPYHGHAERYERAREFAEVVLGLWDSWDDDAFIRSKKAGLFFDPGKMRTLNHSGKHFSVRGPLNVPRSPQGAPVLVQAGSSDDGRNLAADTAEVVFTAHQNIESAQAFYADVKHRAVLRGRDPNDMKIMPGVSPIVGKTRQEAHDKYAQLQQLIHPDVSIALLSRMTSYDFTQFDSDAIVPEIPPVEGLKSRSEMLVRMARQEGLTIRQLATRIAGARGHWQLIGTAADIADELEAWFLNGAADGFNMMPALLPETLDDIVRLLIPELQRRGLFRKEYEGTTLRENLGLRVPVKGSSFGTP
jgi:FMN-dependent oxidoreductase (nitrilotriacetate monooxygenase family)